MSEEAWCSGEVSREDGSAAGVDLCKLEGKAPKSGTEEL